MPRQHRPPPGAEHAGPAESVEALDALDLATLRQLDDTRFLAIGNLDGTACERLAGRGLVNRQADAFWKITPAGRDLVAQG